MSRIKKLAEELRRRSLWQILLVYAGASYAILEAVDLFTDRFGLPDWYFEATFILIALGLVLVVATALLERAVGSAERPDVTEVEGSTIRRLFTWRNALVTVAASFLIWGVVATGWLAVGLWKHQPDRESSEALQPTLDPNRIAVLYFDDHSEGEVNAHLTGAFTEALTHELSQVPGLNVLSRSAVKQYQGSTVPVDSIARVLGAGTLVEGSVLGSGDSLQVTTQAIDANTMVHLLSIVVGGSREEPLAVLEEFSRKVPLELRRALGKEMRVRELKAGTDSDEAWELVQRASRQSDLAFELMRGDAVDAADRARTVADSLLAEAEKLDRDWVEPPVARGWIEASRAVSKAPDPDTYEVESTLSGLEHANRALELAPGDASALELRGMLLTYLSESGYGDPDTLNVAAEQDLRAAVLADSTRALAYSRLSWLLMESGRFAEAKVFATHAYRADPFRREVDVILFRLCQSSLELKEFDDAYYWCREGRRRDPTDASFLSAELLLLVAVGPAPEPDSVWPIAHELLSAVPERRRPQYEPAVLMQVSAALARAGLADSARSLIRRARTLEYGGRTSVDYYEAQARLQLGERDEAIRLLGRYLEADPDEREYIAADWWWEPLHGDSRFQELVRVDQR